MCNSIFLSYPIPYLKKQQRFIELLKNHIEKEGFQARTLGVSDYDMDAPLVAIRRLMQKTNGLIAVAFKRYYIEKGVSKPNSDLNQNSIKLNDMYMTSPYCQIEPAMAFQLELPVLVFRESGVIADGILEKGVLGSYMPEFDLKTGVKEYFTSQEFIQIFEEWTMRVRKKMEKR